MTRNRRRARVCCKIASFCRLHSRHVSDEAQRATATNAGPEIEEATENQQLECEAAHASEVVQSKGAHKLRARRHLNKEVIAWQMEATMDQYIATARISSPADGVAAALAW